MILPDSSAWIDFLRNEPTTATEELDALMRRESLAMCEPVAMELLAGVRNESEMRRVGVIVDQLTDLAVDPTLDFREAASIFREVRRTGRTVRSLVDCLIAAVALRHGAVVAHKDADFDAIAHVVGLEHLSWS